MAFIARLAALVPPARRHTVRYFGVLASLSGLRSQVVLAPSTPPGAPASGGFNLHAATRVAANDKAGRECLFRYSLRPPFANDRLWLLPTEIPASN